MSSDRYLIENDTLYFTSRTGIGLGYRYRKPMLGVDLATFELLEVKDYRDGNYNCYGRDIHHYYRGTTILPHANPDDFEIGENLLKRTNRLKEKQKRRAARKS